MSRSEDMPTVLVVDDAPANLNLLAGLLQADYRVKLAASGAKALDLVQRAAPDLVLLDVMMPEMDGYEVCQKLRANPATRGIPIIFLTAKTEVDDVVRGFEVGASDYVSKPFRPAELLGAIEAALTPD
jgi:putative two-component system response regulator